MPWRPSARFAAIADGIQTQIGNLEDDSFSGDSGLNSEVSVLNKINAAGVLTLRTLQDSNKLLASLLKQQTILAKQQRDQTTNAINIDIGRDASLAANMAQVTGTITIRFKTSACPKRAEQDAQASKEPTASANRLSAVHLPGDQHLLTQNLGFFDTMGQNLFRSFATILVAWFGIKSALASASGRPAFQFDHFASLLLTISFGFAMVNYYSTPIPGIGTSFHNLVTDEAQFLSSQIDQAQLQTVVNQVANFRSPGWTRPAGEIFSEPLYTSS